MKNLTCPFMSYSSDPSLVRPNPVTINRNLFNYFNTFYREITKFNAVSYPTLTQNLQSPDS